MGDVSVTDITRSILSSISSAINPTISATDSIASSRTGEVTLTSSSNPTQITVIPASKPTARLTSPPPLACRLPCDFPYLSPTSTFWEV